MGDGDASADRSGAAPRRMRVLLLEDDVTLRQLIAELLVDEGYEVVAVGNGARGLASVGELRPDAILIDLNMPVLDGPGFVAAYRALPGPHAPMAVLTASGREVGVGRALGLDGHLGKPFDVHQLLALVERLTGM